MVTIYSNLGQAKEWVEVNLGRPTRDRGQGQTHLFGCTDSARTYVDFLKKIKKSKSQMAILGLVLGIEANPQMLNLRKGFQPKKRGVDLGDILKRKRNRPQPINREKQ